MIYDFIIAGLGPAGSTASYELSKCGFKVLAFDKAVFPRYKACGGGISPKVKQILPFSIDELIGNEVDSVVLTNNLKDAFLVKAGSTIVHMAMRDKFDYFLLNKAKSAGALIKENERVLNFNEGRDTVEVITDKSTYIARFLIGSDGANSLISKKSKLADKKKYYLTLTAELKLPHEKFQGNKSNIWVDIGGIPHGCAWIFPKEDHVTLGIGIFSSCRNKIKNLNSYIYKFIDEFEPLSGAEISGKIRGHYIATLVNERSKISKGRIFLAGEAAGFVDPFTGEGIYYAIRSAQILSSIMSKKTLLDEMQKEYYEKIKKEFFGEFKIAQYISKFVYTFPKYSHSLLFKHRHLGDYYLALLKGDVSYSDVYKRMIGKIKLSFKEKGKKLLKLLK